MLAIEALLVVEGAGSFGSVGVIATPAISGYGRFVDFANSALSGSADGVVARSAEEVVVASATGVFFGSEAADFGALGASTMKISA